MISLSSPKAGLLVIFLALLLFSIVTAMAQPKKVIVTGAGGQTGQSLFRKLLALPEEFDTLGLVRTPESKSALVESGVPSQNVAVVDVTNAQAIQSAIQDFTTSSTTDNKDDSSSCTPLSAFCICTSAKPKPTEDIDPETGRPVFGFPDGSPEQVDWIGQKQQIDACPPGTHIVVCSSMGGTNPANPLNAFGRKTLPDGSVTGGNILLWKRKAEQYLIDQCQNDNVNDNDSGDNDGEATKSYTIVHPGGLINEPGGEREIVVGVDDDQSGTESRSIPREDVAAVMLAAVRYGTTTYKNRSFDIRAKPVGEGKVTTPEDMKDLLQKQIQDRNCDYSLGETM